jgi:3-oxo-5-alpha-steroid 4-dehydrogenase 1
MGLLNKKTYLCVLKIFKTMNIDISTYHHVLWAMAFMGLFVFVTLYFVDAGYGKFRSNKWGYSINNKLGWVLMECPALIPIAYTIVALTPSALAILFMSLYALHYVYRSFIFPALLKGNSKMPLAITAMGATFNFTNSTLLCASVVAFPKESYTDICSYAGNWNFWLGIVLFFMGMYTHMKADHTIRNLRKPGDTNHYLPKGGLFDYVTSANYFGELLEWTGFAILLCNPAAWMFVWWTAANLVPRAHAINKKYRAEFGNEQVGKRKRVIPFIY